MRSNEILLRRCYHSLGVLRQRGRLLLGAQVCAVLSFATAAGGDPCVVVDSTTGTVFLPPDPTPTGCNYLSGAAVHAIINGLPAGTKIELAATHKDFICRTDPPNIAGVATPPSNPCNCAQLAAYPNLLGLGSESECAGSTLSLDIRGVCDPGVTGPLCTFQRTLDVPVDFQTYIGPQTPGASVQLFDTEMVFLQGQLPSNTDPDFCEFMITAGKGLDPTLPKSPGHTMLVSLGVPGALGNTFDVNSSFDINYRIAFTGCPGSVLAGMGGPGFSTTGMVHMEAGQPKVPAVSEWGLLAMALLVLCAGTVLARRRAALVRS